MPRDVFISYSTQDKEVAHAICAWIEDHQISCWIAPRDILPSKTWGESIINAIKESKMMLVIFSSNANSSPQIKREVERAVHFGVAVLPMRIENVSPTGDLDYFLAMPQWFNAFAMPLENYLESLVGIIREIVSPSLHSPLAAATPEDSAPYRTQSLPYSQGTPRTQALPEAVPAWPPELLQKVERDLALTQGPIAKVLVRNAARRFGDWPSFTQDLASHIDQPKAREAFLKFCGQLKP